MVLLRVPNVLDGEVMLQVTPVFELFVTVAVTVDDWPGLMVVGLADTETVIGTPAGVPLLDPHAAKKTKLPTIKKIEKLRTTASSQRSLTYRTALAAMPSGRSPGSYALP